MFVIEFADKNLDRLETDPSFTNGLQRPLVRAFRKVMQALRAANNELDLYNSKGLHYEKLKGNRSHQRSIRLNDQWRLVLELNSEVPNKKVTVIAIEDYH